MKKILFVLMLFVNIGASAQEPLEYSKVIQLENVKAGDIYNSAKKWIVKNFRDANSVIEFDNPQENEITGKGNFNFIVNNLTWYPLTGRIGFSINVKAKDGRFKIILADFRHSSNTNKQWNMGLINKESPEGSGASLRAYRKMLEKALPVCDTQAEDMFKSIEEYCQKNKDDEDNW